MQFCRPGHVFFSKHKEMVQAYAAKIKHENVEHWGTFPVCFFLFERIKFEGHMKNNTIQR